MRKYTAKIRDFDADITVMNEVPGQPPTHVWIAVESRIYPNRAAVVVCGLPVGIRKFVKHVNLKRVRLQYQHIMIGRAPRMSANDKAVITDPTPEQLQAASADELREIGICCVGTWPVARGPEIAMRFNPTGDSVSSNWARAFDDLHKDPDRQRYTADHDELKTWTQIFLEQVRDAMDLRDPN